MPLNIADNTQVLTDTYTCAAFCTVFWKPKADREVTAGLRFDHKDGCNVADLLRSGLGRAAHPGTAHRRNRGTPAQRCGYARNSGAGGRHARVRRRRADAHVPRHRLSPGDRDASGNPLFTQIVQSFEPLMRTARPAAWQTRGTVHQRQAILDLHSDIAQSIADRDDASARENMDRHFAASIADLL